MEFILKPVKIGEGSKGFIIPKRFLDLDMEKIYKVKIEEVTTTQQSNDEGGENINKKEE